MNEHDFTDQFVPTFVNSEPEVLSGLTEAELVTSITLGFFAGLFLGVLLGVFVIVIWGVFIFIGTWIAGAWFLTKAIKSIKQGKPKGYMSANIKVWLVKGLGNVFNKEKMYLVDEPLGVGRSSQSIIVILDSDRGEDENRH